MAYSDLYTSSFDDLNGDLIDVAIQEEGFLSASTPIKLDGEKPVEISYNLKDRAFSTGAVVNIVNDFDDKLLFAKMMAEPYKTYKLIVEKTPEGASASSIYFEGFLLPQTFSQNVKYRSFVSLTFSNGVTMLENVTPSFLTTGTDDYITEMDILINIFSYLNLDYTIYINSTLYEDSMSSAEQGGNPLEFTYLNRFAFQKNNGEWDDALTILNKILKSINAYCYIRDERIMIERFVDKATNPKIFWTYNPLTETYSSVEEGFTETALDLLKIETGSTRYQIDQPIKELKLKLKTLQFSNIISNNFDKNISSGEPVWQISLYYWLYHYSLISILDTNFSNAFMTRGISFTKAREDWTGFEGAFLAYYSLLTNNNDDVVLSLSFKCLKGVPLDWALDFRYIISLKKEGVTGWFYVTSDDTITSTQTELEATIEAKEKTIYDHVISQTMDLSGKLDTESLTGDLTIAIVVYPPEIGTIADPEVRNPRDAIYGDFSLNQSNIRINNLLEVNLNNDAFKTVEETLDLYDSGYINYRVSKILNVAGGYQSTNSWTDDLHTSKSLQQHYILNRGNLWNASSPILDVIVNDRTADIKIDDILYTSLLKDDLGNNMKFYVAGFKYNMRQHTYTLTLKKWLTTVGKNIT